MAWNIVYRDTEVDEEAADWLARRTAPGVTNSYDFSGANDFVLASTNGGHVYASGMDPTTLGYVVKDTSDGITGGCCLRIDTPAAVGANTAAWMFPFSTNYTSNASNIGNEIWIQFRFKIPASRLVLSNCGGAQRGWKWMNIAQYSVEDTDSQSYSNTQAEHVLQDTNQRGLPQAYHNPGFEPFQGFAGGQITLQTAVDRGAEFTGGDRYCHYPDGTPGCYYFPTDEWMTFQVRILALDYTGTTGTGNEFDVWYAPRYASEWTHLFRDVDYAIGSPNSSGGGFTHINGGHLLTYETNRINSTEDTWHKYDQVIVGTQEIPLPGVRRKTASPAAGTLQLTGYAPSVSIAALSELEDLAASLSANAWGSLTVNGMSQALITRGDSDSIISYCKNGQWDPSGNRMYFWGSTHGTQHLKRLLRYILSSNTWESDQDGAPETDGSNSHGYWHFTIRPSDGQQFHRHYGSSSVSTRASGGSWSSAASLPGSMFVDWNVGNAMCWHPGLNSGAGGLVFAGSQTVYGSNTAVSSWSELHSVAGLNGDYHNAICRSAVDNLVYFGGGNGSTNFWRVNANGTVTQRADLPFSVGADGAGGQGGLFGGATGHVVAISSAGSIREFNDSTNTWSSEISTLPFTPDQETYFGVTIPSLGVIAFVFISSGLTPSTTMHVWKH